MSARNTELCLAVGAAAGGAALATGLMWHRMTADGVDYARESWYVIPALWGATLLALWVSRAHRVLGGALIVFSALSASLYFSDVYGELPGAILITVGLIAALDGLRSVQLECGESAGNENP